MGSVEYEDVNKVPRLKSFHIQFAPGAVPNGWVTAALGPPLVFAVAPMGSFMLSDCHWQCLSLGVGFLPEAFSSTGSIPIWEFWGAAPQGIALHQLEKSPWINAFYCSPLGHFWKVLLISLVLG